jgi:glycosyltransferase involved in cell wall biosynthesis
MKILLLTKYNPLNSEKIGGPQSVTKALYNSIRKSKGRDIDLYTYKLRSGGKLAMITKSVLFLLRARGKYNIANIDTSSINFAIIVGIFKRWVGCPVILTVHGLPSSEKMQTGLKQISMELRFSIMLLFYPKIITVSTFLKSQLITKYKFLNSQNRHLTPISNGVDEYYFVDDMQKSQHLKDIFRLFVVGGIKERKGIYFILSALQQIHKNVKWELTIAGPADNSIDNFKRIVKKNRWSQRIRHFEWLSGIELKERYLACDVLLATSRFDTFNVAVLEGMATKNCVVTTKSCGASELITNWYDGVIVKFGDIPALVSTLETLHAKKILQEDIGHHAYVTAQKYKWEVVSKKYYEAFENFERNQKFC